jgi:ParB family chromosome partitioning protein
LKAIELHSDWYKQLVADVKLLAFEGIVRTKHAIGKRILEDELKFGKPKYGRKTIEMLAKDLDTDRTDLYRCIKFARKFPELLPAEQQFSWRYVKQNLLPSDSLVSKLTGNAENYTPEDILDKVKIVLGGIDLDPASCDFAQRLVKANRYYTKETNGLDKKWGGRVFLNPPYGMPEIRYFTEKLVQSLPDIEAAILLTNDQTDTKWWQKCAINAKCICMPSGRLHFYTPERKGTSPTNGQTLFYFGDNDKDFCDIFSETGLIMKVDKQYALVGAITN